MGKREKNNDNLKEKIGEKDKNGQKKLKWMKK